MGTTASDVVLHMNATEFASLAEAADGLRGQNLVLVRDSEGHPRLRLAPVEGDVVAAEVRVWTDLPPRKKVREVICVPEEGKLKALESGLGYDAVFWSDSAVGKFLYPYYHSQRLWNSNMDALKAKFETDMDAIAIAHLAPSNARPVEYEADDSLAIARVVSEKVTGQRRLAGERTVDWIPLSKYAR